MTRTQTSNDTRPVRTSENLDWQQLANYLRRELGPQNIAGFDPAAAMQVAQFPGGHSNLTYLIRFGGAELVMRWGLPPWAAESVRWHNDPWLAVEHRDEALTTALASHLAHGVLGDGTERDEIRELALRDELGLYPEDFEELLARREHVLEVAAALG